MADLLNKKIGVKKGFNGHHDFAISANDYILEAQLHLNVHGHGLPCRLFSRFEFCHRPPHSYAF
ncbi:hypothetical protein PG996_002756 [Apiospora saccharicola]|uniref:Uncharacterized protein n=1 Tax=Apiospora saccharicola TaxID=335842 RepID=A0ABR1WNB2_9PEZI